MNSNTKTTDTASDIAVMRRIASSIPTLPRALRDVAEYVLRHPMKTATMTIEDLAKAAGTSPSAVNRFARAVDYGGFSGLKSELLSALRELLSPVEKINTGLTHHQSGHRLSELAETGISNLKAVVDANPALAFEAAVTAISAARRVYVLGFGNSAYLASAAASRLVPYFLSAISIGMDGGNEQAAYRLASIAPGDLLLAISLPRYSRDTVQLARFAKERGALVVSITDSPTSPLQPVSDHVLYAPSHHPFLSSSSVPATLVIESIVSGIMARNDEVVRISSDLTESVLSYLYLNEPTDSGIDAGAKKKPRKAKP